MLWKLILRLLRVKLEFLVWIDQGIGLAVAIPFYIIFGHPRPNAQYTISEIVAYYSDEGHIWALGLEWWIDRIFYAFEGFQLGHCQRIRRKRMEASKSPRSNYPNK